MIRSEPRDMLQRPSTHLKRAQPMAGPASSVPFRCDISGLKRVGRGQCRTSHPPWNRWRGRLLSERRSHCLKNPSIEKAKSIAWHWLIEFVECCPTSWGWLRQFQPPPHSHPAQGGMSGAKAWGAARDHLAVFEMTNHCKKSCVCN